MNDIKIRGAFVMGEYLIEDRRTGKVFGRVRKDLDERWFAMLPGTKMLVSSEAVDRKFRTRSDAIAALVDLTAVA